MDTVGIYRWLDLAEDLAPTYVLDDIWRLQGVFSFHPWFISSETESLLSDVYDLLSSNYSELRDDALFDFLFR